MLRFSLGPIPVGIRPSFWLVALLLGWSLRGDRSLLVAWVAIVFVSVLAHELGHALTARRYGAEASITLTTFGGYTRWSLAQGSMAPGRRAVVAAAGSAVGILVGLAVWGLAQVTGPWPPGVTNIVTLVVWVNVGWGVLNWLPIRPLDGGHMVLALLDMVAPRHSERIGTAVFLVTGVAALLAALYFGLVFAALLAGFMTWSEVSRWLPSGEGAGPIEFSYDREEPTPPEPPGQVRQGDLPSAAEDGDKPD